MISTTWFKELVEHVASTLADQKEEMQRSFEEVAAKISEKDLGVVKLRFLYFLLVDNQYGMMRFTNEECKSTISDVAGLLQLMLDGKHVSVEDWRKVINNANRLGRTASCRAGAAEGAQQSSLIGFFAGVTQASMEAVAEVGWAALGATCAVQEAVLTARAALISRTWAAIKENTGVDALVSGPVAEAYYKSLAAKLLELLQEAQKAAAATTA